MSCEMISSRKIDYYVNDPYVTIIDIRLKEKFLYSRIKGAIHYEYNKLVDDRKLVKKEYNEDGTNLFIKKFVPFFVNAERFLMNLEKYLVIRKKYTYFIAIKVL